MNFELKIQEIQKEFIRLRIWSTKKIELKIRDIKFFGDNAKEGDIYNEQALTRIWLNNGFKVISLNYPSPKSYTALTFIIENLTDQKQFATSVFFEPEKIIFKEMTFGS